MVNIVMVAEDRSAMKWLLLALGSMFVQQTFIALGKVLPAVLAPVILVDLNIDPSWLGIYIGMIAATSLVVQVGCGSIIVRYGALRMSQVDSGVDGDWSGAGDTRADPGHCPFGHRHWGIGIFHPRKFTFCLAVIRHPGVHRWCFPSSRQPYRQAC